MFGNLIVWYLFLGGTGAGLVAVLAALDMALTHGRARQTLPEARTLTRRFFSRGYLLALAILGLGAACLLVDLGHPERFYYVLTHPTFSLLTFGSYVLVGTMACAAALGAIALFNLSRLPVSLVRIVETAALVLSVCTMVYTGLFLADIDFVALWRNPALPVLFMASALSAGVVIASGLSLLDSEAQPTRLVRLLVRADALVVVFEIVCVVAYCAFAVAQGNTGALISFFTGENACFFWMGFVGLGLVAPLALEIAYTRIHSSALLASVLPCVLIGGFILRYCVVNVPLA